MTLHYAYASTLCMFNLFFKVAIQSVFFLYVNKAEIAARGCMKDLKWMNSLPYISRLLSLHFKKINRSIENDHEIFKFVPLTIVATANYFVFHFIEKYAKNVLNVRNWPRLQLKVSREFSVHPIRSIGFRMFTEEVQKSTSVKFRAPIDATDMAVNCAGQFIIIGLDQSKETVVHVYSDTGEFEFAVCPTEEDLDGKVFQPCAVFTNDKDDIYVYSRKAKIGKNEAELDGSNESDALLFIFNKNSKLQRIVPVEHGFMALETKSGKIIISSKKGVFVYEKSGELLCSFAPPDALTGSACPVAACDENTIIQTDIHLQESNVYLLNDAGEEIRHFQVKKSQGWKHIAFNPLSDEILILYFAKDLNRFQIDAYFPNGLFLARIALPDDKSSHPRSLNITPCGRVAVLYENRVHFI